MQYFFGTMIFSTSLFLILLILIQRGRGGGLAGALGGMGGQSAFGTKAGDLFTRITIGVAAVWIILSVSAISVLNTSHSVFGDGGSSVFTPKGTTGAPDKTGGASGTTGAVDTGAVDSKGEKGLDGKELPLESEATKESTEKKEGTPAGGGESKATKTEAAAPTTPASTPAAKESAEPSSAAPASTKSPESAAPPVKPSNSPENK